MATSTPKLGLTKPAGSDAVDIAVLNANSDKIDAAISITICTSTTRPSVPFDGQKIFETDTKKEYVYIAATTTWEQIVNTTVVNPMVKALATTTVADQAARNALFPSPAQGNSVWRNDLGFEERYYAAYNASTNPGGRTPAGWYSTQQGGLVPITPATITRTGGSHTADRGLITFSGAVTSISLNGVFSDAYKNYKLVVSDLNTGTGSASLMVRLRNSGTDNSDNSYYQLWTMKRLTGTFQDNTGGPATAYSLVGFDNNTAYSWNWSGDIIAPFATKNTCFSGQGMGTDASGIYMLNSVVVHTTASSFDSITFYPSTNNMRGTIQIFGYNK